MNILAIKSSWELVFYWISMKWYSTITKFGYNALLAHMPWVTCDSSSMTLHNEVIQSSESTKRINLTSIIREMQSFTSSNTQGEHTSASTRSTCVCVCVIISLTLTKATRRHSNEATRRCEATRRRDGTMERGNRSVVRSCGPFVGLGWVGFGSLGCRLKLGTDLRSVEFCALCG